MKIDLQGPKYYRGLGDIVMWAWLAEGARGGPDPLVFHRTQDLGLMGLLGLQVDSEPGGIVLDEVYKREVDDGCRRPRLDYIREFLGVTTPLARPALHISAEDEAWATKVASEVGSPMVLLFPQAIWKPREWPANYWVDLAWKLKRAGVPAVVLMKGDDARFHNTPSFRWNTPLPQVAALMKRAALVVGNDSFPAHLAGTVGAPTLALMGPTLPMVFAHMPDVECLASRALDCTGCHFRAPFRAACDQGCMSLYRLFPDDVLQRVLVNLGLC
jgi:Glycosyltransferase family 9 (heptosyltransferase)